MNVMVFDIETVPDVDGGARLFELSGLSDEDVAEAMMYERRQKVGHDMLPLHLQQIVSIAVVLKTSDNLKVWSLGDEQSEEKELIERFYQGLDRFKPTLVSWNGSGFDLPVLHYRAMRHRVSAPGYWETGENDSRYRYNNYLNRYHNRHTDLMDLLALYNNRAFVPLDQMASLLGYPGKMGMDGGQVWPAFQAGKIEQIRHYCETDVLNTYLVYLRFQQFQGQLTEEELMLEEKKVQTFLCDHHSQPHWQAFEQKWMGHLREESTPEH